MTTTSKNEVEGSFNWKTSRDNVIYTLFYTNIYEFSGNCEVILDEGMYKIYTYTMHVIGWKADYFKSAGVSMLGHGGGFSQFPHLYYIINIYIECYHIYMWEVIRV